MPGCKNGIPCPIKMGKQWIILKLDFSKFGAIIGLLKNNAAYQIQLTMKDKASSDKTCIVAQGRALTH
ncbi:hypothetical protein L596_017804 [Steinernema carpocapsae]|uniref:MD-2-related lipid-recognition domain-containing protein n=1 Tax=Steinernema carpocapsae TaxID=34508 RepID=A0A4U5N2Q4_STECR|nr:hypothetical protein L596_017804 [Steinernema carpocapsae]